MATTMLALSLLLLLLLIVYTLLGIAELGLMHSALLCLLCWMILQHPCLRFARMLQNPHPTNVLPTLSLPPIGPQVVPCWDYLIGLQFKPQKRTT